MNFNKGIWALGNQGMVSLGNFLTNIFLARMLVTSEYGIFAILFGSMLLLNSIQAALVTYPFSLEVAVSKPARLRELVGAGFALTGALLVPEIVLLVLSCARVGQVQLALLACAVLATWQFQETCRRGLLAQFRYKEAMLGDAVSYLGQPAAILLLWWRNDLSLQNVLASMAVTSVLALIVQAWQGNIGLPLRRDLGLAFTSWVRLGRWPMLTNFIVMGQTVPMYVWLLGVLVAPRAAAAMQSIGNVVGLTHPILFSMPTMMIPATAVARSQSGKVGAWMLARKYTGRFAAALLPCYLFLCLFPGWALTLFYGRSSSFLNLAADLRIVVVAYAILLVLQCGYAFLMAMEVPHIDLLANLVGIVTAGATFYAFFHRDPLLAAALAMLAAVGCRAIILLSSSAWIVKSQASYERPRQS